MDVLRPLIFCVMLATSSCAKVGYLVEQGIGQYDLLTSSRPNEIYLKDPETPEEVKSKIRQIQRARDYFYEFWETEKEKTYSRTTLLDRPAVSYLVISSPKSVIRPEEHCFWFVGCFPYLGFYSQDSAKEFAHEEEFKSLETYIRPVYAYSSLGHFDDPILSSFFVFDEQRLTELVFHELYHLLFFVKNEVELNENLAQFVAQKMLEEYFDKPSPKREEKELAFDQVRQKLVERTQELQAIYKKMRAKNETHFEQRREEFIRERFRPYFENLCEELDIRRKKCFPLHGEWNNARLAAFLTYEKKNQQLSALYRRLGGDLKGFQLYIQRKYQQYEQKDDEQSFADFLLATD